MSWKQLLESLSESVNDHIRLRNEYLMAENRILRNQIEGQVRLTDRERQELAELGAKLGKKAPEDIATVATPDTILAWHRKFADQKGTPSKPRKSVGRPPTAPEIEDLVVRMARENRSWSYDRIQGALKHPGYTISDQTVGNILKCHGLPPAPERQKTVTWGDCARSHWDVLLATNFFNSEVWSWYRLAMSYLLSFIYFSRHHVQSVCMTFHQPLLAMQALVRLSLDLGLHMRRWVYQITERSQASRVSDPVLEQTECEGGRAEVGLLRSQDNGKVILLSTARSRPKRDGPRPSRHQLDRWLENNKREAA